MTAGNRWAEKPLRKRALVLVSRPGGMRSRRAQVSSFLFFIQNQKRKRRERQNRRAPGTSAGVKWDVDGRLRPEATQFSPVTGDPWSPVALPSISATAFHAQHLPLCGLCVLCGSLGWVSGSGSIWVICGQLSLCPLCLCGFFGVLPWCLEILVVLLGVRSDQGLSG